MKLAVIGTGIAGMACAYFLRDRFDEVVVYEKNDYVGGHTNTVYVDEEGRKVPIDTGFMVYNDRTYPNLIQFFDRLGIVPKNTSMSFSVNHRDEAFEASFSDLKTFFPSLGSFANPSRYRLLAGLKRLFERAHAFIDQNPSHTVSLKQFVREQRIPTIVTEKFLLPMTAAIWSTPHLRMLDYPAATLFRFLSNHGMLGFGDQFQWKTLVGGSQQYKSKILQAIGDRITTSNGAVQVTQNEKSVDILDSRGERKTFDKAILASHADESLALLKNPSELQSNLLSRFHYNRNPVSLHTDPTVMPRMRRAWASWNYRYERMEGELVGSTHYWMNNLQGVSNRNNYFVSVDYKGALDESKVLWRKTYHHPRFDEQAIAAQRDLPQLNENGPLYFCGSYFKYGFHEDAFTSALHVSQKLNHGKDPLP
ncbi:FAD-dependent oxidoreductase [Pelagicoccus sp. SDUM812003]|uniref:NAD(P)/FAD-dependent oxidoreductase n=1 Tax=Pelagicoccus sp. SDUM812003 TaxID=3041267 RepID=UPI00280F6B03|nr:FAD-dependent oxidoreductase [Pelagicoccus sp. SDUM812003]MDQ8201884.1 FAD-dependent oxidoreductase [Pelagicoccus sp. SDUM812003]